MRYTFPDTLLYPPGRISLLTFILGLVLYFLSMIVHNKMLTVEHWAVKNVILISTSPKEVWNSADYSLIDSSVNRQIDPFWLQIEASIFSCTIFLLASFICCIIGSKNTATRNVFRSLHSRTISNYSVNLFFTFPFLPKSSKIYYVCTNQRFSLPFWWHGYRHRPIVFSSLFQYLSLELTKVLLL